MFKPIEVKPYKQKLNRIIIAFILLLTLLALLYGKLFIVYFANSENHFTQNLLGVVAALITCAAIANAMKSKPYFSDVIYVWQLKQSLMPISQKIIKIEKLASQGNQTAMLIWHYYLAAQAYIYRLESNSVGEELIAEKQQKLMQLCAQYNLSLAVEDYHEGLLKNL